MLLMGLYNTIFICSSFYAFHFTFIISSI